MEGLVMTPRVFRDNCVSVLASMNWASLLGYPPGTNEVYTASMSKDQVSDVLEATDCPSGERLLGLYAEFDGLSWPDVQNGYYLRRIGSLIAGNGRRYPRIIDAGSRQHYVLTIGSSGGGDYVALDCSNGQILICGDGTMEGHALVSPRRCEVVAGNVEELLDRMYSDLQAFASSTPKHKWLF